VKDASGAPVPGVTVAFVVTGGGGSVQNATATTDAQGVASAGQWTLGPAAGTHTLDATTGTLPAVHFSAAATIGTTLTVPSSGDYTLTIRYLGALTQRQLQAVTSAITRWQSVITRDVSGVQLTSTQNTCFEGQPDLDETIDDLLIFVEFVDIDGAGNVLGQAGPCYVRSGDRLPILGHLKLDAVDLQLMEVRGTLDDVVLHEIGHILGIGTLWPDKGLIAGAGTADPTFTGGAGLAAYRTLGGTDPWVPVENTGSAGTRDGHWRESVFGNELMSGYISSAPNPMSILTVESLTDLGYGTEAGAAGSYTLSNTVSSVVQGLDIHKHERIVRPKFEVDRHGNKRKLR
jgi:hypothetical protein